MSQKAFKNPVLCSQSAALKSLEILIPNLWYCSQSPAPISLKHSQHFCSQLSGNIHKLLYLYCTNHSHTVLRQPGTDFTKFSTNRTNHSHNVFLQPITKFCSLLFSINKILYQISIIAHNFLLPLFKST
jgi:hypothetical protein